ncbi:MAG TPA: hypothetical protein VLE89_03995 [Chlamydiales bacterium]|nr:hypothetical protein [Chlamydiales bacterium]
MSVGLPGNLLNRRRSGDTEPVPIQHEGPAEVEGRPPPPRQRSPLHRAPVVQVKCCDYTKKQTVVMLLFIALVVACIWGTVDATTQLSSGAVTGIAAAGGGIAYLLAHLAIRRYWPR